MKCDSFADCFSLMIILLWIAHLLSGRQLNLPPNNYLLPILFFITIISPICILGYAGNQMLPTINMAFLRWIKYVILCILVSYFLIDDFDIEYGLKVMKWFVFCTTFFVLVQRLYFSFGIIIRNPISSFAINDAYDINSYSMEMRNGLFRPSALFLEPVHLSQYFIVFIIYSLLSDKRSLINAFIASIGVFATGSGMGIIMILAIFLLSIILSIKHHPVGAISLLIVFIAICSYLYTTDYFQMILYRIIDGSDTGGNAISARSGAGYLFFAASSIIEKLFGHGFGNVPIDMYLNGVEYSLISIGIIGVSVLCISSIRIVFKESYRWQKVVWLFYIALLFFAQLFSAAMLYYYVFAVKPYSKTDIPFLDNQLHMND